MSSFEGEVFPPSTACKHVKARYSINSALHIQPCTQALAWKPSPTNAHYDVQSATW